MKAKSRHRYCDNDSIHKCSKEHFALELSISFDSEKSRDYFFEILKQVCITNLNDDIVDRLDLSKVHGELANAYQETFGIHSISVWANGNKHGWVKPLLEGVDP